MLFSGNDFFKLTKTFVVVHLDCGMSTWRKTGACAGFGHRRQRRKNVFFWIAGLLKTPNITPKWAVKVFEEWQSSRRDKAPRQLASSLTALDLTNIPDLIRNAESLNLWLSRFVEEREVIK